MHEQLPSLADKRIAPAIDKAAFRQAMSRLGAAVNIITTDGPAGRAGFTACAVCSVTDEPPTLLVCLNRSASVYQTVLANGVVCINTLAASHQALSTLFGGKTPMNERFSAGRWSTETTRAPALEDALMAFDCEVTQVTSVGSHDVLFCEIHSLFMGEAPQGLLYFERQYHALGGKAPEVSLA